MFDPGGLLKARTFGEPDRRGSAIERSAPRILGLMSPEYGDHCPSRENQFFAVKGPGRLAGMRSRPGPFFVFCCEVFDAIRKASGQCQLAGASIPDATSEPSKALSLLTVNEGLGSEFKERLKPVLIYFAYEVANLRSFNAIAQRHNAGASATSYRTGCE